MRFAHFPHNKIHYLRGEAARAPGERGRRHWASDTLYELCSRRRWRGIRHL